MNYTKEDQVRANCCRHNHAYKSQAHLHLIEHKQQVSLAIWAAISGKDETTFYQWHMTVPKRAVQSERGGNGI